MKVSIPPRTKLEASLSSPKEVMISLKEGLGMRELEEMVQKVLGEVTGMVRKKLKVPINGNMLALVDLTSFTQHISRFCLIKKQFMFEIFQISGGYLKKL